MKFLAYAILALGLHIDFTTARTGCNCAPLTFSSSAAVGIYPANTNFNILYAGRPYYGVAPDSKTNDGYCIVNDQLTQKTITNIETGFLNNQDTAYVNITGGNYWCRNAAGQTTQQGCANYAKQKKLENLKAGVYSCTYPTSNFEPVDCFCGFVCTNGYVRCGTNCINPATQVCSSGAPAPKTRRSLRACSPGSKICPIGRIGWECIDTQNSLESCGGCPNAGGQDCSVLPGADQVACVDGACRISSCIRGQSLALDGTCVRN